MKRIISASIAILVLSLIGITAYPPRLEGQEAKATASGASPSSQAFKAVNIVRAIDTAEVVTCRSKNGKLDPNLRFRPWADLFYAPCFKKALSHYSGKRFGEVSSLSLSSGPAISPGLRLRLVVSADRKHYNVWLGQKPGTRCGFAIFSDERGVIYEGKAIGCDAQGPLGKL